MYRFWEVWSPLELWRCYPRHRVWEGVSLENVDCESFRMDEEWLDPRNVRVESRVVTDTVTSIY